MSFILHQLSSSPDAWRVQLALVHKNLPFTLHNLSYAARALRSTGFAPFSPNFSSNTSRIHR
jgi:glutathione S-transferase